MTDDTAAALVAAIHDQRQQQRHEADAVRRELRARLATIADDPNLTAAGKAEARATAEAGASERLAELRERHEAASGATLAGLARRAYGSPSADLSTAAARAISLGRDGTLTLLRTAANAADACAAARVYHDDPEVLAAAAAARGAGAAAAHDALVAASRTPTTAERLTSPPAYYGTGA